MNYCSWQLEFEGHPDNVAPTIYGGLVLGYYDPETKVTDVSYIDPPKADTGVESEVVY